MSNSLPRSALVLDQLARNAVMALPPVARWRARRGRTSDPHEDLDRLDLDLCAYRPFDMLLEAAGPTGLAGLEIAEIGPGDHVPTALLILAAGASRYLCIDRFAGDISGPRAKRLYLRLAADLERRRPVLAQALAELGIVVERFPEAYPELVCPVAGAVEARTDSNTVDIVFSNNVLEHLTDISAFGRVVFEMLRPGGLSVNRVDFSAHDVWRKRKDPLEWLTIPDRLWHWMGSHRGSANRLRFNEVCESLREAELEVDAHVFERFEETLVRTRRPHLARRFRGMPLDSLTVKTAEIRARRPIERGER